MTALKLEKLQKTYRNSWGRKISVLKDITMTVKVGEIYGLLGVNGAGKSTTFKAIVGLIRPSRGSGELLGHPLGSREAREGLGYLPENPYFYDYLTPTEFLETCAAWYGMTRAERRTAVPEVLERVGLDPKEKRRLRKFSKGMLQRIGMAQAIIHNPKMVILDEPMSGLDPQGRSQFRDIILNLKREGKTVLFASHILSDVEMICDRVGILNEGRITRTAAMEDVLSSNERSYEVEVAHLPDSFIKHLESEEKIRVAGPRYLVRAESEKELEERIHQIFTVGGKLISVRHTHVDLEKVFLAETSGLHLHEAEAIKKGAA